MARDVLEILNNGGWSFVDEEPIGKGDSHIDRAALPYLTSKRAWDLYSNQVVYQGDLLIREFISTMSKDTYWKRHYKSRMYTFGMLFEILYDRPYGPEDRKYAYILTKLFAYYSVKIQKEYYKDGVRKNKTAYTLMTNVKNKPPYSLKLRIDWLVEKGEIPNHWNMAMPKDDLKPGHARNPKTEANMEKRRQLGKERYNEYQRRRKQLLAEADYEQQAAGCDD